MKVCDSGISRVHGRSILSYTVTISRLVLTLQQNGGKHSPFPPLLLYFLFLVFCPISLPIQFHSQAHWYITAGIWSDSSDKAEGPGGPGGDSKGKRERESVVATVCQIGLSRLIHINLVHCSSLLR